MRGLVASLALGLLIALPALPAHAQISGAAFSGFGGNSKKPINIEADELEVIDGEQRALFKGNVRVTQGESTIRTSQLEVIYLPKGQGSGSGGGSGGQGNISKLNLTGGVVATSGPNTAQSERGTFDVRRDVVTLEGNVILTQGENVAKGCRLTANLKTNVATIRGCGGQRPRFQLTPGN